MTISLELILITNKPEKLMRLRRAPLLHKHIFTVFSLYQYNFSF